MPYHSSLPTVYTKTQLASSQRASPRCPSSDIRVLVSVTADPSITTFICQTFIKSCAEYVRLHNLTISDTPRLIEFIRQRSVVDAVNTEAPTQDDAGRNPVAGKLPPHAARKRPVLGKGVA